MGAQVVGYPEIGDSSSPHSRRTEQAYAGWARRYVLFHGKRHSAELGEAEIGSFLSHLAEDLTVSASTPNQALKDLVLLYRHVFVLTLAATSRGWRPPLMDPFRHLKLRHPAGLRRGRFGVVSPVDIR